MKVKVSQCTYQSTEVNKRMNLILCLAGSNPAPTTNPNTVATC